MPTITLTVEVADHAETGVAPSGAANEAAKNAARVARLAHCDKLAFARQKVAEHSAEVDAYARRISEVESKLVQIEVARGAKSDDFRDVAAHRDGLKKLRDEAAAKLADAKRELAAAYDAAAKAIRLAAVQAADRSGVALHVQQQYEAALSRWKQNAVKSLAHSYRSEVAPHAAAARPTELEGEKLVAELIGAKPE